jgi:hypothetical protein
VRPIAWMIAAALGSTCLFGLDVGIGPTGTASRLGVGPRAAQAAPAENVGDCVSFDTETADDGLRYRVSNTCRRVWRCSVSWELTCQNAKHTRRHTRSVAFSLPIKGSRDIAASVAACGGDDWAIDAASWSCNR